MKRLAAIAVAATLLSVYACAAEDSAPPPAATPATTQKAPAEKPEPTADMERAKAPVEDKLTRVSARDLEAQAKAKAPVEADAPTPNVAARNISDPARVAAGDEMYKVGRDYIVLTPAQRTSSPPEKIEITEVFMYQCPHCFSFEPFIDNLKKEQPPEVNFVRLPAIFNPIAELHAKAFYAAKALGVWEQLHLPFFREIHTNRNLMRTEDKLLDFVETQGIERQTFAETMQSFEVDSKVRDAKDLNRRYRIDSVPTMVVNGKYVTSANLVGSTAKLKSIIDYLVSKEATAL